ncbi:ATP-dependent sacrificial sulfur transferase LarE [bacterium]|nr:ATP-dependent sacrificial sulfur transferase LarE [bacterium]
MGLEKKIYNLKSLIKSYGSVAIAFSGGVDSTFLTKIAFQVLGENSLALTVDSIFFPREELRQSREIAKEIGVRHEIITIDQLDDDVLNNKRERCYLCKTNIFGLLLKQMHKEKIEILLDGSNIDDLSDYRPGMRALKELSIVSPLIECDFSKAEIRLASKELGLPTWNKPSLACLASRIPYHQKITKEALLQIEKSEDYLRSLGLIQVRVRYHQDIARIEVDVSQRQFFFDPEMMDRVNGTLKSYGFKYVTFDLEGYKTGNLN